MSLVDFFNIFSHQSATVVYRLRSNYREQMEWIVFKSPVCQEASLTHESHKLTSLDHVVYRMDNFWNDNQLRVLFDSDVKKILKYN